MIAGLAYGLAVFAVLDGSPPTRVTWHATMEVCRNHIPVERAREEIAERPVAWIGCSRVRAAR